MSMDNSVFCDYFSVSQEHPDHESICGLEIITDPQGEVINKRRIPTQVNLGNGSSVRVFSDGNRVSFSGNPSRAGRLDNYQGVTLDQGKNIANNVMRQIGLPEFTSGAKFTQIDMTVNMAAGKYLKAYLRALQCAGFGRLETTIDTGNVYFGKRSRHRQARFYDKGREIREKLVPNSKGHDRQYLVELADWNDKKGVLRQEVKYIRALDRLEQSSWETATQESLSARFKKEVEPMTNLEVFDLEEVPMPYRATLALYMTGADLANAMHPDTLKRHKRELKKYGYEINNKTIMPLRARREIIVLTPAGTPDFYRHPDMEVKVAVGE